MIRIFFLLFLFGSLYADSTSSAEADPSSLVAGKVNAITGKWHPTCVDLIIQGAEPIVIRRTFVEEGTEWAVVPSLSIGKATSHRQGHSYFVVENSGARIQYKFTNEKALFEGERYRKYKPIGLEKGYTNTSRGSISSQTNLHNQALWVGPDEKRLKLCCPDGTVRTYKKSKYRYRIITEHLPNGRWILYGYKKEDKTHFLTSIRTTNPSQTIVYAEAQFSYRKRGFQIVGSDGQIAEYEYDKKRRGLSLVRSSHHPDESFTYVDSKVRSITHPLGRRLEADYYTMENTVVNGETIFMNNLYYRIQDAGHFLDQTLPDPRSGRIKTLSATLGNNPAPQIIHSFLYDLPHRKTRVYDLEQLKTEYEWNTDFRLIQITRYDKEGHLQNRDRFTWSPQGHLLSREFVDPHENPLWTKSYLYNERGDLLQEKMKGSQGEEKRRRFTYFEKETSQLCSIEEDSGKKIEYSYLGNTNLLTSESIYFGEKLQERTAWHYDENHILIRETVEDESLCLIREITPNPSAPYQGMPWIIEEKTDQKLLRKTILSYTTGGKISQKSCYDAEGTLRYNLHYTYDEKGRLIEQTDPLGRREKIGYDACGNRTLHQKFSGRTTATFAYNFSNQLTSSKQVGDDGVTLEESYEYDLKGRIVREKKPLGWQSELFYDSFGRLSQKIENGLTTSYGWDFANRQILQVDPAGHTTHTTYNSYGKPTQIMAPNGGVQTYRYTSYGALQTAIDPLDVETSYTYDWKERPLHEVTSFQSTVLKEERTIYNRLHPLCHIDAEGIETRFVYDRGGNLISKERGGEKTTYEYDALGRLSSEKRGELSFHKQYDLADRLIEETHEDNAGKLLQLVQYQYDISNNQTACIQWIDGQKSLEEVVYDSIDRPLSKIDPLGHTTHIAYETTPFLKETTTNPLGLKTVQSYNAQKKLSQIEIYAPEGTLLDRQNFTYDPRGLITEQSSTIFNPPRTLSVFYRYNEMGRLIEQIEAPHSPHPKITRHHYNLKGDRTQTTKPSGVTLDSTYTPLGHLHSLTSSDATIHYIYTYDRLGRLLTSLDRHTGQKTERRYDPHGRLLQETLGNGHTLYNQYDSQGRRTLLTLPDQSSVSFSYNPLHLTKIERINSSGRLLYIHTCDAYDTSGHLLQEGPLLYKYDRAGRKISHTSPHHSHEILARDALGNILHSRLGNTENHYTYDALSQLQEEKGHTYRTDAQYNCLQKDKETFVLNEFLQPQNLEYDTNGNLLKTATTSFSYDALDRLIKIKTATQEITYTYDTDHRRLTKNGHHFLYDGPHEIGRCNEKGELDQLRILRKPSQEEAIAIEIKGEVYLPRHDLYGNVLLLVSLKTNKVVETYHYNAFGEESSFQSINPWRYAAKRCDEESGLLYYGRRYYSPTLFRWLTADPAGFTTHLNLYSFVRNNPLRYLDLFGLYYSDRVSDINYFDPHHPELSAFYCGSIGNAKQNIDYHCGINNSKDDVSSAQACLYRTLNEDYSIGGHHIHNHNLLHGLSLVGAEKLETSRYLKYLSPIFSILAKLNLTHSYINEAIGHETQYLFHRAEKILEMENPSLKQLHVLFSNASYSFREALLVLPPEHRDTIIVISAGPTTLIENSLAHRVYNIIGSKDYASKTCNGFFESNLQKEDVELRLIKQNDTRLGIGGHFFEQTDYQNAIKELVEFEIQGNYEIY